MDDIEAMCSVRGVSREQLLGATRARRAQGGEAPAEVPEALAATAEE